MTPRSELFAFEANVGLRFKRTLYSTGRTNGDKDGGAGFLLGVGLVVRLE
jgi:hypothetical protein